MALLELRRPENVPGDFFVDDSCIDCDLCRQIAPKSFVQSGDQSVVNHQPEDDSETLDALKALVTCPTASIGTISGLNASKAVAAYPEMIEDEVYFCGFASEASYGGSSYLIQRPDGNVLVDSPRFIAPLVRRIEAMGGLRWMFLTHRDDVADHDQWAKHFGLERIMHKDDAARLPIERVITGKDEVRLTDDLLVIPTPGHTRGHMALLFRNHFLFSGDHLWWSENYHGLNASRSVNWYSWPEQIKSLELLLRYSFEWVLPGHGRRAHASAGEMKALLQQCLLRLRK